MNEWAELANSAPIAGAVGGIVRFLTFKTTWKDGAKDIITGALTAQYATPSVQVVLGAWLSTDLVTAQMTTPEVKMGLSFLIGFAATAVLVFVQEVLVMRSARKQMEQWQAKLEPPSEVAPVDKEAEQP